MVDAEEAAEFRRHDAAIAHAAITAIGDVSQELQLARAEGRNTAELDREMSDAFRIAGELGASGNLKLRAEADRWPHLRDAILAAEARHVIDELETARQMVDEAKREMIDTDLVDESLQTALRKGMDLALEGNHYVRDYAERDPELKEWIADGERDDASEALEEISHYRHNVHLAEDPNFASRFYDSLEDHDPAEGLDCDMQRRYAEAERTSEDGRGGRLAAQRDDHVDDRQNSLAAEQPQRRPDERMGEMRSTAEAETTRSGPPQQHVPRLREIEREIEARQERDRDDRER